LVKLRRGEHLARELVALELHVARQLAADLLLSHNDRFHLARCRLHRHDHARAHLERAAVYFLAVDPNVAVGDELLRAEDGRGEAEAIHDVVEAALELLEEELRGVALREKSLSVGVNELLLADHAIDGLEFLSLLHLHAEV